MKACLYTRSGAGSLHMSNISRVLHICTSTFHRAHRAQAAGMKLCSSKMAVWRHTLLLDGCVATDCTCCAGVSVAQKHIGDPPCHLSARSRAVLLPQYTKCIRWPHFIAGKLQGGCSVLHVPTQRHYKPPSDEFRQISQITVDVSECRDFIDDLSPPNLDITIHPRVNVTLRPQSTDHPVFLQVRRAQVLECPSSVVRLFCMLCVLATNSRSELTVSWSPASSSIKFDRIVESGREARSISFVAAAARLEGG